MIWLTFVTPTSEIRLPFLAHEELPVFVSRNNRQMVRAENILPGTVVEGRGTVIWCDYVKTPDEDHEDTDPPCGFWEQVRFDNEVGLHPTVVDVSWIDDNDGCGPAKLSNPIRCF